MCNNCFGGNSCTWILILVLILVCCGGCGFGFGLVTGGLLLVGTNGIRITPFLKMD